MKVENSNANRIVQKQTENTSSVERNQRHVENDRMDSLSGKDQASLSERARLLVKLRGNLEQIPEIRASLVNELRDKVSTGNYQVPVEQLAGLFMKGLQKE